MEQQPEEKSYVFRPQFGNEADIARLIHQHNAYRDVMKLFSRHFRPKGNETILDIGCGPGAWAIDVAFAYPEMSVIGIDIDESAIRYAMAQAVAQHIENVSFEVADAMQPLPFRDASVDYVNITLASSFMLKDQWPKLLAECHRVLRPGGWIRLFDWLTTQTSSLAIHKMDRMYHQAFESSEKRYIELAPFLKSLLRAAGLRPTPLAVHVVDFSEDAPAHKAMSEDIYISTNLLTPFIVKSKIASKEEYEALITEAQKDMMLPNFYGLQFLSDISAQKPE